MDFATLKIKYFIKNLKNTHINCSLKKSVFREILNNTNVDYNKVFFSKKLVLALTIFSVSLYNVDTK